MRQSKLFSDGELKAMEERKLGYRLDKTGIFANRIRPKILELFEWFKKRKELLKLVEGKRK